MKNHYKLLVLDVDGTLVDGDGIISPEDEEAIVQVHRLGIPVALSTGRAVQACQRFLDRLALDGHHIFFDGALVSNPGLGEEVYAKEIKKDLARQAVGFAHEKEMNLELFSSTHYFVERETWASDIRRNFFRIEPTVVDFDRLWQSERIIKGTLVVASAEEKAKANSFRRHFARNFYFSLTKTPAYPEVDFINIVTNGVSKGNALEALAAHLGIPLAEVIAIGDGLNDVSLLDTAGLGIAMAGAPDALKAVADSVTLDVKHSGVALAVKQFLL
ncbi:MAG: Cof-type HAD-IIB family hydrolase [Chloroflexota bacterium]